MYCYNLYKDGQLVGEKLNVTEIAEILGKSSQSVWSYTRGRTSPPEGYRIEFAAHQKKRPQNNQQKIDKLKTISPEQVAKMPLDERYAQLKMLDIGNKFTKKIFLEWVTMNERYGRYTNGI